MTTIKENLIRKLWKVILLTLMIILSMPGNATTLDNDLLQRRTITGTVTDQNGEILIGVSITLKGTTTGAITGTSGTYSIEVPSDDAVLVFSYIGFETQEIPVASQSVIDVTLVPEAQELEEIVVTALNISRSKKSLGYSVQQVSGDEVAISRTNDLTTSLSGKISGIQVFGTASSTFGDSRIRIRGVNDLSGSGAMYVVDGTPVNHSDIDMSNVESVSVLKGPSAAALYGQRASKGVILISTKTGKGMTGTSIEVNSSVKFENLAVYPKLQNMYGQGNQRADGEAYQFPVFNYNPALHPGEWEAWDGQPIVDYATENSWGPKMDDQLVREWFSWYPDDPEYGQLTPFDAHPNNYHDFYNTGITLLNDVAVTSGNENYNFRASYANQRRTLIFPGAVRDRNFFNIGGSYNVNKRITFSTSLNIVNDQITGAPAQGDVGTNVNTILERGLPRQIDIEKLRNYNAGQFRYRSWNLGNPNAMNYEDFLYNRQISSNPFVETFENIRNDNLTRVYGFGKLSYKIADNLMLDGAFRTDYSTGYWDTRIVSGSRPDSQDGTSNDSYGKENHSTVENNYEILLTYKKRIGEISFDSNLGGNIRKYSSQNTGGYTVSGLMTPGVYALSQSFKQPEAYDNFSELETRSIYGRASVGYKDMLYVDGSLRNDWSSTLPIDNNSYLYPSVSTSLLFSELVKDIISPNILSFGKLRFGLAQVGSDMGPYNVYTTMPLTDSYGLYPAQGISGLLLNPNIKPTLSTSWEGGLEMKFLQNRVGFELSMYKNENKNQILNLTVPNVSGYNSMMVNAGMIISQGVDLTFYGTPVSRSNFTWDISFNISKNTSIVEKLAEGQSELLVSWEFTNLMVSHIEGEEWMYMRGRRFMRFQSEDAKGNPIYHENNGKIIVNDQGGFLLDENQPFGSALPDYVGGMFNSLKYKNFDLAIALDFQIGGLYFSRTNALMDWKGYSEKTVGLNDDGIGIREPLSEGGGISPDAVTADGELFTGKLKAQDYFGTYWWLSEPYVYDATYIKLRDIRFGYTLPGSWFNNTIISSMNLGAVMSNVLLIYNGASESGMDPSEARTNYGEDGQLPNTRSIGFNLNVKF